MATQLFFLSTTPDYNVATDTVLNVGGNFLTTPRNLATARGGAATSLNQSTAAGPTTGKEFSIGALNVIWYSPPLAAAVTIAGSVTWNLRAAESSNSANTSINAQLEVVDGATGAITIIDRTARTTELGTSEGAANFAETPAAGVACKKGDRLRVRVFGDDAAANMGSGFNYTFWFNGPTAAASGDSYLTLTENLTFVSEPAGTTIYPTDTAATLGGATAGLLSAFTGATEFALSEGGNWAPLNSSQNGLQRLSNTCWANGGNSGSYWTPTNFGPDVEAYVTLTDIATIARKGIAVRVQGEGGAATWDGYYVHANDATAITIDIVTDGTRTQLATVAATWTSGDKLGVACHGSTIEAWQYTGGVWTRRLTTTNSTYSSAGKVALWVATQASGTVVFDDFYAGTASETFSITEREAWTSRGAGVQTDVTNTAAGLVVVQTTDTAAGTVVDWFTRPLGAFTLGGAVRCNVRGLESALGANATARVEIARTAGDGTSPTVWAVGGHPTEFGLAEAVTSLLISGDDLAVSDNQRLRIRLYLQSAEVNGMVAGSTATTYYAGTSGGASGDTYLTFTQTLTEFSGAAPRDAVQRRSVVRQAVGRAATWCKRHDGLLVPERRIWTPGWGN